MQAHYLYRHTSHVTRHTSHVTRHTSHVTIGDVMSSCYLSSFYLFKVLFHKQSVIPYNNVFDALPNKASLVNSGCIPVRYSTGA